MSSAPNHGNVTETAGLPSKHVSIGGHVQQVFSHVKIENLVAGLSGGVVSTMVLHPLDLVKIRFAGIQNLLSRNNPASLRCFIIFLKIKKVI